jgi:hypothetical protein
MKKAILILTLIALLNPFNSYAVSAFDSLVPEFTAIKTDTDNATSYTGYSRGLELIINSNYIDINNDPYEESIVRMSTLGVAKQYGDKKYYPAEDVTGYEALGFLVRMVGNEANVMQNVYAQTGTSSTPAQVEQLMNQAYLNEATALGIINAGETIGLNKAVNKETIMVWLGRALGRQAVFNQEAVFSFNDWMQVNPNYRALIETMIADGLASVNNDGSFGPKDTVSRSEMAVIAKTGFETLYDTRGISSGFGLVIGVKEDTIYEDDNTITRKTITVKNTDGTVTNLLAEKHTKGNRNYNFVVYKNGYVSDQQAITLGDEIEYILDNNEVKYLQVMSTDQILEKINASTLADVYATFHSGVVSEIKTQNSYNLNNTLKTDIFRIVDVTGDTFDILVDENIYTGIKDDIVTFKADAVGGTNLLEVGDNIAYLVNEKKEVIYIKVAPIEAVTISGSVREVKPLTETSDAQITVYGYDDKVYEYPIAPYADLTVNQRYTDLENFVYGMNVTLEITNGYVVSAMAESYSGEPGYIPEYGKMRIGTVVALYNSSFMIKLSNGNNELVTMSGDTKITKDGNVVSFSALKLGNDVKVYYNDIYSSNASKLEIEAPEVLFEVVYKGKIKNVNEARGEIQMIGNDGVSKPQYIENSDWVPADDYSVTLKVDDKTEIYSGNNRLSIEAIDRSYTGYTAYAVVKSEYGKPKVVMMTLKTGGEMTYSSTVRTVDHTLDKFDISTRENFNITEGTIVIKDGLIVPSSQLSARDSVYVVSESPYGTYYQNAMIVKVVTPYDDIFNSIRIGALEDVNGSSVSFRNYTSYTNNFINDVDDTESGNYKLYTSSEILDVTDPEDHEKLTAYELFNGSYSKWDNVDKNYTKKSKGLQFDRYYAFAVVNEADSSILSLHVRHKGLLNNQNIDDNLFDEEDIATTLEETFDKAILSRGMVVSNDETWDRLEITDAHDWTDYTGQWTANRANIYIQYTDAIFIKNNDVKTINDVQNGDYIYIMRISEDALVIFIES